MGPGDPPLHSAFLGESSQLPVCGASVRSSLQLTDWLVSSCKNRNLSPLFQCSKASGIKSKLPARCSCVLPPLATALHGHATTLWAAVFAHAVPSAGNAFLQLSPVSSYASFKTHLTPTSLSSSQSPRRSQLVPFLIPKHFLFPSVLASVLWYRSFYLFIGTVSSLKSGQFLSLRPAGTGTRRGWRGSF